MKKVTMIIMSVFLLIVVNSVFAESWSINSAWKTENLLYKTSVVEASTGELTNEKPWVKIDKSLETTYIYYYGQWCSHCAKVDRYMGKVDWYTQLNVEKKEIYFEQENSAEMLEAWKRLWLSDKEIWVPLLLVNKNWKEQAFIWDKEIIDFYTPILWEVSESNNKTVILIIFTLLAILIPTFIIKMTNK